MERLVCSLMFHGRNNGKKLMAVRIVRHTFEIIHLLTGEVNEHPSRERERRVAARRSLSFQNPLQVLVNAIINSGPREDSTRIGRAGTVRRQAVDVSPLRRVNQALYLICTGTIPRSIFLRLWNSLSFVLGSRDSAFRSVKTIAECLADELINAAKVRRLASERTRAHN